MARKGKKKKSPAKSERRNSLTKEVLGIFTGNPNKTFNHKQIAKLIGIRDTDSRRIIINALGFLKGQEEIAEIYPGKFKLKSKGGYILGKVDMTQYGYAYIVTEDIKEDIYVSKDNLNHSLN